VRLPTFLAREHLGPACRRKPLRTARRGDTGCRVLAARPRPDADRPARRLRGARPDDRGLLGYGLSPVSRTTGSPAGQAGPAPQPLRRGGRAPGAGRGRAPRIGAVKVPSASSLSRPLLTVVVPVYNGGDEIVANVD